MATSRNHIPRIGPSKALMKADPDEDIRVILSRVPRFECQDCGTQKFGRSSHCGECGSPQINKILPPQIEVKQSDRV